MLVKLFPNTGHHFFFLGFGADRRFPYESIPAHIVKEAIGNQAVWSAYQRPVLEGEKPSEPLTWCQWRYGTHNVVDEDGIARPKPGIWVCVETNIGGNNRGSLLRDPEPWTHCEYVAANYPSPYYAEDETDPLLDKDRTETLLFAMPARAGRPPAGAPDAGGIQDVQAMLAQQAAVAPRPGAMQRIDNLPHGWVALQELSFWWPERVDPGTADTEVDLIVDFGNSRSTAVLLERPRNLPGNLPAPLSDLVKPLRMMPRGQDYARFAHLNAEDPYAIFDSWFVTRETLFAHLHPPNVDEAKAMAEPVVNTVETSGLFGFRNVTQALVTHLIRRVPHMFMEMSPVSLGKEASQLLASTQFELGRTIFLSSPKRYLWDDHPIQPQSWGMILNPRPNLTMRMNERLSGHVLQYMPSLPMPQHVPQNQDPNDISDWDINDPPPNWRPSDRPWSRPDFAQHSRSDTMVWAALTIIEHAYRQISTSNYLGTAKQFVRRRLHSVVVTYPPGWTGRELEAYRRKWNTALNIFTHGHLADLTHRPRLLMDYDEALGAQLPIIFSEINKIGGSGDDWIRLVGRPHSDNGRARVRVMSIDIGGGTTDYAIFEYHDRLRSASKAALECQMLFKDSSTTAGDVLVRQLIEEILLPRLGEKFRSDTRQSELFETFFRTPHGDAMESWGRITRLVLIPKINQWLARWGRGWDPEYSSYEDNVPVVDLQALDQLNQFGREAGLEGVIWDEKTLIPYGHDEIDAVVRQLFQPLFQTLARIVTAFGVDMVVVSGKPSELPVVQTLLKELIPLLPGCIVPVKEYYTGEWYPYQTAGRIYDAKTVTASGVALLRAIDAAGDLVPGWVPISIQPSSHLLRCNCWIGVAKQGTKVPMYLHNGCGGELQMESDLISTTVGSRIGRTLLLSLLSIEPVYLIVWTDPLYDAMFAEALIEVKVRRVLPEEPHLPEYLELIHAQGSARSAGQEYEITPEMVHLQLCTLTDSSFWIDTATFNVKWPR